MEGEADKLDGGTNRQTRQKEKQTVKIKGETDKLDGGRNRQTRRKKQRIN